MENQSVENKGQDNNDQYLTIQDVRNYIKQKTKENKELEDVEIKEILEFTNPIAVLDYKLTYYLPIFTAFNQACEDLKESAEKNTNNITRKVVIFTAPNCKDHIFCFVLFHNKQNQDRPISCFSGSAVDIEALLYCKKNDYIKKENTNDSDIPDKTNINNLFLNKVINLQKDKTSCGVVACEMAKHLTVDWYNKTNKIFQDLYKKDKIFQDLYKKEDEIYKKYLKLLNCYSELDGKSMTVDGAIVRGLLGENDRGKDKSVVLKELKKEMNDIIDKNLALSSELLPEKLLAYRQGSIEDMKTNHLTLFQTNNQRGDIVQVLNDNERKLQNHRLQNRKKVIKECKTNIKKQKAKENIQNYINTGNVANPIVINSIKKLMVREDGKEFLRNCHCNIALRARAKREHQVFLTYAKILNNKPENVNELVSINDVHSWNMCGCSCC